MVVSPALAARAPQGVLGRRVLRSFWPAVRVRRPVDVARLVLAAVALAAATTVFVLEPGFADGLVPTALTGLPRTALSVLNGVASLAVIAGLVALLGEGLRSRPFAVTCAALAGAAGVLLSLLIAAAVTGDDTARTVLLGPSGSAGLPVTATIAVVVGADLPRRRWRVLGRLVLTAAVLCDLGLGSLTATDALYALLAGAAAGLAVRVGCGVVPARPPDEVVLSLLAGSGWPLDGLRLLDDLAGRASYAGVGGPDLSITVIDSDRRGVPLGRRAWRLLRLRTAAVGRPSLSLRGQLERQALSAALAQSAGVAAPRVLALLAAGPSLVLLEQPLHGTPLPEVPAAGAAAATRAALRALRRLHDVGLAHGALSAHGVVLLPDGRAGFADLSSAQPATTDLQRELDVVALLVALAPYDSPAGAVAALRADYRSSPLGEARLAALLQPLALPGPLRRAVRGTGVLAGLREVLGGPGAAGPVAAVRLERLRPRTVLSIAGATLAAHILATQLSSIGLGSALGSARPGWLVVALLGSAVTYLGSALALQAFVAAELPLGRTALVQLASSFLTLVTPPAVGHIGLNIRYLQRAGVPTATATASVAVKEACTVLVTVPVLLVCGWLSGVSASRLALLPSGTVLSVLGVAAAVLALVALAGPSRRLLRRRLEPLVQRTLPQLLATAADPRRLTEAVAGILVLNIGYVLALDASLRAFSVTVAVPTLVVVYLAASTLGSAAPTPGGLGAVEAALVGGLTATGVPVAAALTAVLAFRTATFWLPAPLGWAAFVALQRRGRI